MGLGYDLSRSASASTSATTPNSPLNGSYPAVDFGPTGGGVFETPGGGYGVSVPVAYKEAMMRHFAPVLQDDGQIGVDQDTMMMWSMMPSTYETQDWDSYMSSMLGLAHSNADPAAPVAL